MFSAILTHMSEVSSVPGVRIQRASRARQTQVLWLLFRDDAADLRLARVHETMTLAGCDDSACQHLLAACRGGELVGAAWAQVMPGRAATVWPPRLVDAESELTRHRLVDELDCRLRDHGVHLAYALLPSSTAPDSKLLASHRFRHVADLLYLASSSEQFPLSRPKGPLEFVPYADCDRGRLARLIEETYRDTLDIPALNGLRHTGDVLDGYRQTGVFDPHRWLFITHQGQKVGCLLLTDHPEQGQWELMYMGLVTRARGNGFGFQITRHAQWLTRLAGRGTLMLAVDSQNGPAVATYAKAGFVECDRRSVFLKPYVSSRS